MAVPAARGADRVARSGDPERPLPDDEAARGRGRRRDRAHGKIWPPGIRVGSFAIEKMAGWAMRTNARPSKIPGGHRCTTQPIAKGPRS